MKRQLERWLRKRPLLYRLAAKVYSTLKPVHLQELFIGTKARERRWARDYFPKGSANDWWAKLFRDALNHPSRAFLLEKIAAFSPFSTILEIGCNYGPNLYLVAKKFPDAEIRGIDINPRAVQKGNELLAQEGISNVRLSVGKADELGRFQDKSFDIVFTNSLLMYIGPDKIKQVIKEMVRITRRALILMERHCFQPQPKDPNGLGVYRYSSWERDYVALLRQFASQEQIQVIKIPEEVWPDGGRWKEVGAVIEVVMGHGK